MIKVKVYRRWFVIEGSNPILLVAGHNAPHIRRGIIKPRDMYTGLFTERLCTELSCWGIISTHRQLDPNWYRSAPMRRAIKKLIKKQHIRIVFDIHGRNVNNQNILEVCGNNTFKSLYPDILRNITTYESRRGSQMTLSQDLDQCGTPSISFEIRKDGRVPFTNKGNRSFIHLYSLITKTKKLLVS